MTDESRLYGKLRRGYEHKYVTHSTGQYVRGNVHTQCIENFWSLFKRGLVGSFHKISIKHLDRYLAEFTFRFNGRDNQELFTTTILHLVIASGIKYAELTAPAPSELSETSDEPF